VVEELFLEVSEEVFHHGVVVARGKTGDLQQNREGKVSLEGDEGPDPHRRSCALKARNFPK
jgi:hypothetical protein